MKSKPKTRKRLLMIIIIIVILILPFLINGLLLSETWGQYRSKKWFNQNKDSLVDVNSDLTEYLNEKKEGFIPPNYPDHINFDVDDDMSMMASPYFLKSVWGSHEDTIIAYSYESTGFLVTTSAAYGIYYSESDEPFTVIKPIEIAGNAYATERIETHWFYWWLLY